MSFEKGHALCVGVGTFKHAPASNVPVTVNDARAVQQVLQRPDLCGYPQQQVTLLHDEQADRSGILAALDVVAAKTSAESTVVIYLCSHGEYGTDGNYYLMTHDSRISGGKVVKDTGVSEVELIDKMRSISAPRLLLVVNCCHSGELSPNLSPVSDVPVAGVQLPDSAVDAILSSGEGRIVIAACRAQQKSWIGPDTLTIFTKALVDGLSGRGYVPNNSGYISAYGLYEHLYFTVKEAAAQLGHVQEPELTILRGVGPFPVALYHGASHLGLFQDDAPIPEEAAVRVVDPKHSQRLMKRYARSVTVTASGPRSVAVGGRVSGSTIVTGDGNRVGNANESTDSRPPGSGASVDANVNEPDER